MATRYSRATEMWEAKKIGEMRRKEQAREIERVLVTKVSAHGNDDRGVMCLLPRPPN